jgi:hypothetical protein
VVAVSFPFGIWVADRYLYIPAIGAFVVAAIGFFRLLERASKPQIARAAELVLAGIFLLFGWTAYSHLPVWRNNVTLWEATTPGCDTSAYCHASFGAALLEDGQVERGIRELIRSVELRDAAFYLMQLGDAYATHAADYRQAVMAYDAAMAKTEPPAQAEIHARVARAYVLAGDFPAARQSLETGITINRNEPSLWAVAAFLGWKESAEKGAASLASARESLDTALLLAGQPPDVGIYLLSVWQKPAEVDQFLRALKAASGHTTSDHR